MQIPSSTSCDHATGSQRSTPASNSSRRNRLRGSGEPGACTSFQAAGSRHSLAWDRAALWSAGSRHFPCENKRARFPSSGSLRKRRSPFSKGRTRAHPMPNQATKCRPRTLQMRHATRYACSQSTRLIQRPLISEIFNSFESNHSSSRVLRQLNRRP